MNLKREIGSEFWDVPVIDHAHIVFPASTTWFLSGRCALQAIIAHAGIRSVSLPSWLCDSMIKPFADAKVKVSFYSALEPICNIHTDALLIMDYFGYVRPSSVEGYHGIVIRDVTHSIFSTVPADADYYFGSLRKWAGFWTGGYGWTSNGQALPVVYGDDHGYVALRSRAMEEKNAYIRGGLGSAEKVFLKTFAQAEDMLECCGNLPAHDRDIQLAKKLDIAWIREKRRENAACLLEEVSNYALFPTLEQQDCPLFVPITVPDGKRDALRWYLIERGIYCPVHWPLSALHTMDNRDKEIYKNELSLVCDQRYTTADMEYVIRAIKEYWKG